MKKIILLCLILLNGYTNIDLLNNSIIHQQIFDQIDIDTYQNIMIVAHPDDETIWGGGHLLKDKYLVICLTNGNNKTREKEFNEVMNKTHNQGIILDYPDKTNNKRDDWKTSYKNIINDLKYLLSKKQFKTIVTHNPKGEYGHQHHKMTSAIVTNIVKNLKQTDNLKYFGNYYQKNNPVLPMIPTYNKKTLKQKNDLIKYYKSQKKVCHNLKHMFPYENWISYKNWK